jgi:hypothetical protein
MDGVEVAVGLAIRTAGYRLLKLEDWLDLLIEKPPGTADNDKLTTLNGVTIPSSEVSEIIFGERSNYLHDRC